MIKKLLWAGLCCVGNAYAVASAIGLPHSMEKNIGVAILGFIFYLILYPKK